MTDVQPYESLRDGGPVYKALGENKLPAQVDALDAPDLVKQLLRRTWRILPASRIPMRLCCQAMANVIKLEPTVTPGTLRIKSDWGSIILHSPNATIRPDPTVDETFYEGVTWTKNSMKFLLESYFFVDLSIPYVTQARSWLRANFGYLYRFHLITEDEYVDIELQHGCDSQEYDRRGEAVAEFAGVSTSDVLSKEKYRFRLTKIFAQTTYVCPVNDENTDSNPKLFKNCRVNGESATQCTVDAMMTVRLDPPWTNK